MQKQPKVTLATRRFINWHLENVKACEINMSIPHLQWKLWSMSTAWSKQLVGAQVFLAVERMVRLMKDQGDGELRKLCSKLDDPKFTTTKKSISGGSQSCKPQHFSVTNKNVNRVFAANDHHPSSTAQQRLMWSPRQWTAVSDRLMLRRNLQRQGHRCCNTASTVSHHLDRQPLCQRAQRPAHHLLHHNHKVKLQTTIHCIATFCQ